MVRPALFSTRLVALPLPFPLGPLTVGFSVGRAPSVGVCQPFSPSLLFALVCELTSYHFRWIDGNSVTLRSAAPASPLEQLSRSVGTRVHSVYDRLPRDFDHIGLSPSFSSSPPFFFPLGEQKATTTTTTHTTTTITTTAGDAVDADADAAAATIATTTTTVTATDDRRDARSLNVRLARTLSFVLAGGPRTLFFEPAPVVLRLHPRSRSDQR